MTTTVTTLMDSLSDARKGLTTSPQINAAGIRASLADAIYTILGEAQPTTPYVIRPSSFRSGDVAVAYTPFGRMRGALVTQLMRLIAIDYPISDFFETAVSAWRASEGASELVDVFEGLDADERERLATDVVAHGVVLQQRLGTPPASWMPRTAVRSALRLAGGAVILRDHVDVVLGSPNGEGTGVALVDITTTTLDQSMEQVLRYHAVVETLKNDAAPRFVAALSTATGQLWRVAVTTDVVADGVSDIVTTLAAKVVAR